MQIILIRVLLSPATGICFYICHMKGVYKGSGNIIAISKLFLRILIIVILAPILMANFILSAGV